MLLKKTKLGFKLVDRVHKRTETPLVCVNTHERDAWFTEIQQAIQKNKL